jgi:HD-like signal output (HDOD) protein/DNA-binding response OmpR family regulator
MSNILVVDDMAMCREPIADALRHHGHDVTCAVGGTEALGVLREQKPDLVLLDVTMPDPDGLTVLGIMRRNPDLKDIPVVLLTDRAEKETVVEAAKYGVQGYLLKANFSLHTLLASVDSCIEEAVSATAGASSKAPRSVSDGAYAEWRSGVEKTLGVSSDSSAPTVATALTTSTTKSAAMSEFDTPIGNASSSAKPIESLQDLTPIITKATLTKLVNDGLRLKPLASTVHSVMAVTGSANCCAADVAKAVVNDQALCIRLLKLANSSAYSRGRPADSVQTAVQRIGIQEVRKLVMTLGVFEQYAGSQSTRLDIRLFWEHSIACGLIAAALARECRFKAVDDCFLWGTVHDVGRLILLDHVSSEYAQVCDAADELMLPLEIIEPKLLLLDHCEILKHALDHWQFPHAFIVPVANHHEPFQRLNRLGPEHAQAAMIVALANRIAHALLLGCSGNEMIYPFDDLVESIGVSASAIEKIVATVPDETRELKFTMLAHSATDTWPDFAEVIRTRLDTTVWPLCVSSEPSTDAFKLFLDRMSEGDKGEPPNLGVIYLREAGEAGTLFAEYEGSETKADCGILPLIVVCGKGANKLGDAPWQARPHTVLNTPVPITLFLKSVQGLLAQVVES